MKKIVYTVITGDYDTLRPIKRERGFDYVCFTDNPGLTKNGWDLEIIDRSDTPVKQQRCIKINSHLLAHDLTVYMDANFKVIRPLSHLIDNYYRGGFLTCKHDSRTLISQEIERVLEIGKENMANVKLVQDIIFRSQIPNDCGMYATGFIVRDNSSKTVELEKKWLTLLKMTSHRDQLTLGPASYLTGVPVQTITRRDLRKYAILQPHRKNANILLKPV